MEYYDVTHDELGFHIEGFPKAVKFINLRCHLSKQAADLSLHRTDLNFALTCLENINQIPMEQSFVRDALWHSAISHYFKCFMKSAARKPLSESKIYKDEIAREIYTYFRELRNKHYIHDENNCTQVQVGAILNNLEAEYKIEKILCFQTRQIVLDQGNWANLFQLITIALEWVTLKFDQLCDDITVKLEQKPYEELLAQDSVIWKQPIAEDVGKTREQL